MDLDDLMAEWFKDPEFRRTYARHEARVELAARLTGWMRRIPIVGRVVHVFWFSLIEEGPRSTIKPRYGAMTFSFLNDGCGATVWHTWQQMTNPQGPYGGIWCPRRAPRNRAEADALLASFRDRSGDV